MMKRSLAAALAASSLAFPVAAAHAQDAADQQFGTLHFETSCNEVAQRRFDRGMRFEHSFWYSAARSVFEDVASADPECAMAYWGIALALLNNPHGSIPAPNLAPGLAAIEKAKALGAKTERERDYIAALALMYVDSDKLMHGQRIRAYLDAMEKLAAKYPTDDEAQIFYAITLNTSASLADKTYAQQKKGAAILEAIWKRQPRHPGVAHYLIHLYDYPALAQIGLEAAKIYATIAPGAPHAQHMPSHIFTRVGYWKESIASNAASVKAAVAGKEVGDQLHGSDYMVYAYLQLGRDDEARALSEQMRAMPTPNAAAFGSFYARAASPARYRVERNDWSGAASLEVEPTQFAMVMAITHFARALGAARSGKADAAKADIAKLVELRDKLREMKDAYGTEQVDIQRQVASAWVLLAEGKDDEALAMLRAAADAEDKTEKAPVTPGPLAPARELLGQMLLAVGKPQDALLAFEVTMAKEPNRFNGFAGAAKAAELTGDGAKAKLYYEKLVALTDGAHPERPEVAAARASLAKY